MKKRIFGLVFAMAAVLVLCTLVGAEETPVHRHCICGNEACTGTPDNNTDYHELVIFEPWTKNNSLPTEGNYYLTGDVEFYTLFNTTGDLSICLCGYKITHGTYPFYIDNSFSITDCQAEAGDFTCTDLYFDTNGKLNLYNGNVYAPYVYNPHEKEIAMYNGTLNIENSSAFNTSKLTLDESKIWLGTDANGVTEQIHSSDEPVFYTKIWSHKHDWNVTADAKELTITCVCLNANCPEKSPVLYAKMTPPDIEKGSYEAIMDYYNVSIFKTSLQSSRFLHYYEIISETESKLDNAPTTPGNYMVRFRLIPLVKPSVDLEYKYTIPGTDPNPDPEPEPKPETKDPWYTQKFAATPDWHILSFRTGRGDKLPQVTFPAGSTADLSAYIPTRPGYTFSGWFLDQALTLPVTEVTMTKNTALYAGWEKNTTIAE